MSVNIKQEDGTLKQISGFASPIPPVVSMTREVYEANKDTYDAMDVIIEITDSDENGGNAENVSLNPIEGMNATNVQDGVEELNTKVEKLEKQNEGTLQLTASGIQVAYCKSGNSVTISLKGTNILGEEYLQTEAVSLGILPVECRPPYTVGDTAVGIAVGTTAFLYVLADGNVMLSYFSKAVPSGYGFSGYLTYTVLN